MKKEFEKKVRTHDWYYDYSDDPSVWRRGRGELEELRKLHADLKCPFALTELMKWHYNMVKDVTFFENLDDGLWYQDPKPKYAAGVTANQLIDELTQNKITKWMEG